MTEHEKARQWRERNRYSRRAISEMSGFSETAIVGFETGRRTNNPSHPVDERAAQRYRLCLAAIANGLADWDYS